MVSLNALHSLRCWCKRCKSLLWGSTIWRSIQIEELMQKRSTPPLTPPSDKHEMTQTLNMNGSSIVIRFSSQSHLPFKSYFLQKALDYTCNYANLGVAETGKCPKRRVSVCSLEIFTVLFRNLYFSCVEPIYTIFMRDYQLIQFSARL